MDQLKTELNELVVDLGVRFVGIDEDQLVFEAKDPQVTREDLDSLTKALAEIIVDSPEPLIVEVRSRIRSIRVGAP